MAKKKKETPKVINLNDYNNRIWIGEQEYEYSLRTVEVLKPIRDENGMAKYVDIFRYLLKLIPQQDRDFDLIAGLLSYASNNNGLTDKQVKYADRILDYWRLKGVYDV